MAGRLLLRALNLRVQGNFMNKEAEAWIEGVVRQSDSDFMGAMQLSDDEGFTIFHHIADCCVVGRYGIIDMRMTITVTKLLKELDPDIAMGILLKMPQSVGRPLLDFLFTSHCLSTNPMRELLKGLMAHNANRKIPDPPAMT